MKKQFQKLAKVLFIWDGIWSVPLAFLVVLLVAVGGGLIFGDSWSFYNPQIIHAGVVASFLMVLFNMVVFLGLYFNFPKIFQFVTTKSFSETFENLTPWQKVLSSLFFYSVYVLLLVVIFNALV